jgi:hypothetical protein
MNNVPKKQDNQHLLYREKKKEQRFAALQVLICNPKNSVSLWLCGFLFSVSNQTEYPESGTPANPCS